jgi:hypothetical protein
MHSRIQNHVFVQISDTPQAQTRQQPSISRNLLIYINNLGLFTEVPNPYLLLLIKNRSHRRLGEVFAIQK